MVSEKSRERSKDKEQAAKPSDHAFHLNDSTEDIKTNKWTPTLCGNIKVFVVFLIYIGFNLLGAFIFTLIERQPNEGQVHWLSKLKTEFIQNHSCVSTDDLQAFLKKLEEANQDGIGNFAENATFHYPKIWTMKNAFVLSFTIATTIGYGVVTPKTEGGQIFCMIYALLAIAFTGLLAAKMGQIFAYYIGLASNKIMGLVQKAKVSGVLFTLALGILINIFLPSIVLRYGGNIEDDWSYVNCLYCIVITLTTIGFGDYVPNPGTDGLIAIAAIAGMLVWIMVGLSWFATIIGLIASNMNKHAKSIRKKVNTTNSNFAGSIKKAMSKEVESGKQTKEETTIKEEITNKNNYKESMILLDDDDDDTGTDHKQVTPLEAHQSCTEEENNGRVFSGPGPLHQIVARIMQDDQST